MTLRASVIVPVYDGETTIGSCVRSINAQTLPREQFEVIVVDDGSHDGSAAVAAQAGAQVIRQANAGAAAARNAGLHAARGEWVAFIDADAVASRGWLQLLLAAAESPATPAVVCVAGKTHGLASDSPAARYVDLTDGLDAERHLSHPRYPFAPSVNVLYRRSALLAIGGYDERYRSYEACDLHQRLAAHGGTVRFEPRAVTFHRHRATWRAFWRQQVSYGVGLAQFMRHRVDEIGWSAGDELRAWSTLIGLGAGACLPGRDDAALVRRGTFVKALAQRVGFVSAYWNGAERAKW